MEFATCHPDRPRNHPKRTVCKECYSSNRKAQRQEYYRTNNAVIKSASRARYTVRKATEGDQAIRDTAYWSSLKRLYGISKAEYENLWQSQGMRCAICRVPNDRFQRMHLDHDHATNRVRGILCVNCNPKLGWYERNKEAIESYLESSKS